MKTEKLHSRPNAAVWNAYVMGLIVWLAFSWLVTDHIQTSRTRAIIKEGTVTIDQQADNIAVNVNHDFEYMRGIPEVISSELDVFSALSRFTSSQHSPALNTGQLKDNWSKDTQLKSLNHHLNLITAALGADVVYIMNTKGDCIASSNAEKADSFVGANFSNRDYFQEALADKIGQQYAIGAVSHLPGLYFSRAIMAQGHIVAVVAAKVNLLTLSHWVNQADAFITDKYGVVILAHESKFSFRSLQDASVARLSKEARMIRYKQENFPLLTVHPISGIFSAALKYFDDDKRPLLLTERKLDKSEITIHVFKPLPEIGEIAQDQLNLFFFSGLTGAFVLLLVVLRITFLRNRMQNENRLLEILNKSPIAVRITVAQGRKVVFFNSRYSDLIKIPETAGVDPSKYYVRHQDYEDILSELTQGNQLVNRQIELSIPDGSTVWVLATYMPITYQGENAVLGWMYDITKLKQTEEFLELARLSAETAREELLKLHENNIDDLAVAKNIMNHIMRSEGLRDPKIRYFQRPAVQFSGDIIAAARDANGDLRLMLADVTGHGLQAALFLLPLSRVFYSMVKRGFMTSEIAREMNKTMREIAVTGRFIAAAVAHINIKESSIEIWNGGIPAAYFIPQHGDFHQFRSQHLPMGVLKDESFDVTTEVYNSPQGALLLCTDGLTEAENASAEAFGEDRFEAILRSSQPNELFDNILSSLESHLAGGIAHDDLSIVLAQCSD